MERRAEDLGLWPRLGSRRPVPNSPPTRAVAARGAGRRLDVGLHHLAHHLQPGRHSQRQQPSASRPVSSPNATSPCSGALTRHLTVVVAHSGPILGVASCRTPNIYRKAGVRLEIDTSTPTRPGTTSARRTPTPVTLRLLAR